MTATSLQRLSFLRLGCAAALLLMLCATPSHAQTVAVIVNGDPITNYDIEQRSKLNFLSTHKPQVRKQVIDELIDEKVKIREGKKYSIDPSSSDIDGLYSGMSSRMHVTPDQLTKSLASSGIRPETLKERMRAAGLAADQPNSMPLTGRGYPLLAVFDPTTLKITGIFTVK